MNEQDLSKPAANSDTPESIAQLRFQLNSILLLVVVLAGVFVFHLYHLTSDAGKDLKSIPPQILANANNYQANVLPRLQTFLEQLKEFGKTHPDFQPILIKHGLIPPPDSAPAPAPKAGTPKK
jgi:hypothetical protein